MISKIVRILSLLVLWGSLGAMVVYIDPAIVKNIGIRGAYLPFWGLTGITLWYTMVIISRTIIKSLILTLTIMLGMILSFLGIMHWGLLIVLLLTLAIESWYMYKKR